MRKPTRGELLATLRGGLFAGELALKAIGAAAHQAAEALRKVIEGMGDDAPKR